MAILTNPKHERFAQELANGKSQEEAYTLAGFKRNRGNANTLKQNESVTKRVAELLAEREAIHAQATAQAIKATGLTKEWVIEQLVLNVRRAMQEEAVMRDGKATGEFVYNGAVANKALELLGKEIGMFIERREVGKPGAFDELNADQQRQLLDAADQELARRQSAVAEIAQSEASGTISSVH